jgi:putative endonuclease
MIKWYYVYILRSLKNKRFYTGYTDNIIRRVIEHNSKKGGKYTSINAPYKLIFFEGYLNKKDALNAEKFFKTGYGKEVLKQKIKNYIENNK